MCVQHFVSQESNLLIELANSAFEITPSPFVSQLRNSCNGFTLFPAKTRPCPHSKCSPVRDADSSAMLETGSSSTFMVCRRVGWRGFGPMWDGQKSGVKN